MSELLLEVSNLEVGYGRTQVLRGVSVKAEDGKHVGLFGPNGHGKTTLLRTISGLLKPWTGEIKLRGEVISGKAPREIVERGLIHVAQGKQAVPRDDGAREPDARRLDRTGAGRSPRKTSTRSTPCSRASPNAALSSRARSRAANGRCYRSASA